MAAALTRPSSRTDSVLLVGRRNAAIRAVRRAGFSCLRVDPAETDLAAQQFATGRGPVAVIAVTEAAVQPAARLRAQLGVAGVSVESAGRCSDKLLMKQAVNSAGLRCARFLPVDGAVDPEALIGQLGLPLVLKTRVGSGGRGAVFVGSPHELPAQVRRASIAESFVDGVEMSVESYVVDGAPVFVNCTEYVERRWANLVPARLDDTALRQLHAINRAAIACLGVTRGMTHMEVFLTPSGPVFGELAARPPGGHIMRLIELAYGFDPWRALIDAERGVRPECPREASRSAGVRFIHPGAGVVRSVSGQDDIRALETLHDFQITLVPGAVTKSREGTGQHHGFTLLAGQEDLVRRDLGLAKAMLRVDIEANSFAGPLPAVPGT